MFPAGTCEDLVDNGKFLSIFRVWRNDVLSSHIYGGFYHEFNEWTLSWMWEEWTPFSILRST